MRMQPAVPPARAARSVIVIALDGRVGRALVATLLIGGYMATGIALGLGAEGYLLLGIPITVAFQVVIVRRPVRSLWLRQAPPIRFTVRSVVGIVVLAIAPGIVAVNGIRHGDLALLGWGLSAMVGAGGAVYALQAMDRAAWFSTIRASFIAGSVLSVVMIGYRLGTGGFEGNIVAAITTGAISVVTYLPVVFVMEEVLFRGVIDPYLHGSAPGRDLATSLYGSALWGIWHLPVVSVALGVLTIPYLIVIHSVLGVVLVASWRKTGNLAAPGVAHAVTDALRNAIAAL